MKHSEIENQVEKKIQYFESLEAITPSEDWETVLYTRVYTQSAPVNRFQNKLMTTVVVILVLVNIGLVWQMTGSMNRQEHQRSHEYKKIASELFINQSYNH